MKDFRSVVLFLIALLFISSCSVEDETECINSFDCLYGFSCIDGICVQDAGNTGNTGDTGNSGDSGDTGDTGNTGNTGDTANTGNSGDADAVSDHDAVNDPDLITDTDDIADPDVVTDDTGSDPDQVSDPDTVPDEDIAVEKCGNGTPDEGEVCDKNTIACNAIAGMGYVNATSVPCKLSCDGWDTVNCSCDDGFQKDGEGKCTDINECTVPSHNCNVNATCTNNDGGFSCACNSYFTGLGTECTLCDQNLSCGSGCTACPVETAYCKNNGDNTTECVECIAEENCSSGVEPHCLLSSNTCVKCRDNNDCNTGAGEICNAEHICGICPLPLTLGTRDIGETGWTRTGNWIIETTSTGWMRFDDDSHKTNYDYSLSYASNIDLSICSSATLNFSITLSDYVYTTDPDKSEKMYVECSGDGGGSWNTLVPNPFPSNQSSSRCSNCYCDGDANSFGEKSFGWTAQTMTLPSACKTDKVRFRFRAKGGDSWRLNYWGIDAVTVN